MKLRTVLFVLAAMVGIFFVDRSLATLEHNELMNEAHSLYIKGERLIASGRMNEAIALLQRAHTLARANRAYELALAHALVGAGRRNEAEPVLRQLLEQDSNNGPANLAMARLLVQAGRSREAEAYYHRALYGTWTDRDRTREVRMELVEYLARRGERKQLLPELLLLQDEAQGTPAEQKQLARLFLLADSPARSIEIYRSVVRRDPEDAEAYSGLAEAELAAGDFESAQISLRRALRRKPGDDDIAKRLDFASTLSALDPTPRRMPSKEKYRRSLQVLQLAKNDLVQCAQREHAEDKLQDLLARAASSSKLGGPVSNEASESLLALSEELWKTRVQICGEEVQGDDPVPILMRKIAQ